METLWSLSFTDASSWTILVLAELSSLWRNSILACSGVRGGFTACLEVAKAPGDSTGIEVDGAVAAEVPEV